MGESLRYLGRIGCEGSQMWGGSGVGWWVKVGKGRFVGRNAIKKGRERAQFSSGEGGVQQWRMRSSAVELLGERALGRGLRVSKWK